MLESLQAMFAGRVRSTWASEALAAGTLVKLYRDYARGDHRAKMTPEMRQLLRISEAQTDQFNLNYCDLIVQKMSDRLTVSGIDGDTEAASQWSAGLLADNRFDGLQMDVHDAALRDGITYVMVAFDNETKQPTLAHELAWDGDCGVIPVWDRTGKLLVAAVKVWYEGDARRVNVYWPDRVEKYTETSDGLKPMALESETPPLTVVNQTTGATGVWWTHPTTGQALGVPLVPVRSRGMRSELASVIPIQDALNRTLVSAVMTGELTAFQIRYALGFEPPAKVTPGMWVTVKDPIPKDSQVEIGVLDTGDVTPLVAQALFLIEQIANVSQTPLPSHMGGDTQSGEALKQRESGLIGKVKRFQVKGGNAWEDVVALAAVITAAFSRAQPPASKRWNTRWKDAEVRSDGEVIDNALKVAPVVGDTETLRLIASVYNYDAQKIKDLMAERASQQATALAAALNLPGFSGFGAN